MVPFLKFNSKENTKEKIHGNSYESRGLLSATLWVALMMPLFGGTCPALLIGVKTLVFYL